MADWNTVGDTLFGMRVAPPLGLGVSVCFLRKSLCAFMTMITHTHTHTHQTLAESGLGSIVRVMTNRKTV